MELSQLTRATRRGATAVRNSIERAPGVRAIRDFVRLERILAVLCAFIPLVLVAFDSWSIRDSISAYFDMGENQWFYFPLTVAAMLFIVNGALKHESSYNTVLGVLLSGVILFNHDDLPGVHSSFAAAFFGGNVVVMGWLSDVSVWFRRTFATLVVLAVLAWVAIDAITLFWAEWASLMVIAVHYLLDSIEPIPYAASRSTSPLPR